MLNTRINIDNVVLAPRRNGGASGDLHDAGHSADTLMGRKVKFPRAATRSGIDGEPTGDRRAGQPASHVSGGEFVLPLSRMACGQRSCGNDASAGPSLVAERVA